MDFSIPVSDLIAKIGEMQAEKIRLEGEYESRKNEAERRLKQYKDKIKEARKKLKDVQFELDVVSSQTSYKKPVRQHEFNVFDREIKIEESKTNAMLQATQKDYEMTYRHFQSEINSLLQQAQKKKKEIDRLSVNIDELKSGNKSLKNEINQLRSEIERIQQDSREKTDKIEQLHAQNKRLAAKAEQIVNSRYKPKSSTLKIPK